MGDRRLMGSTLFFDAQCAVSRYKIILFTKLGDKTKANSVVGMTKERSNSKLVNYNWSWLSSWKDFGKSGQSLHSHQLLSFVFKWLFRSRDFFLDYRLKTWTWKWISLSNSRPDVFARESGRDLRIGSLIIITSRLGDKGIRRRRGGHRGGHVITRWSRQVSSYNKNRITFSLNLIQEQSEVSRTDEFWGFVERIEVVPPFFKPSKGIPMKVQIENESLFL